MIDFTFTEEQELFRKAAKEFAETRIAPHVPAMEKTNRGWGEVVKELAKAEMFAVTIPAEYGGLGIGNIGPDRPGGNCPNFSSNSHDVSSIWTWD